MLEKMNDFFNCRVDGYEEHQLTSIDFAHEFYPFTAKCLPVKPGATVLDLGCGTGLELSYYFEINTSAKVVGIDIAEDMLKIAKARFAYKSFTVIQARTLTFRLKLTVTTRWFRWNRCTILQKTKK